MKRKKRKKDKEKFDKREKKGYVIKLSNKFY